MLSEPFHEAIMLLEMIPDMPECAEDFWPGGVSYASISTATPISSFRGARPLAESGLDDNGDPGFVPNSTYGGGHDLDPASVGTAHARTAKSGLRHATHRAGRHANRLGQAAVALAGWPLINGRLHRDLRSTTIMTHLIACSELISAGAGGRPASNRNPEFRTLGRSSGMIRASEHRFAFVRKKRRDPRCPMRRNPQLAVSRRSFVRDDRILLVRRARSSPATGFYSLARRRVDFGENRCTSARNREVDEESRLKSRLSAWPLARGAGTGGGGNTI